MSLVRDPRSLIATGLLLDVDGVLIDSGSMYAATWGAWADLRAVDKTLMLAGIHGERGIDTVARVAPELVAETELELLGELLCQHEHMAARSRALVSSCRPMPGAVDW